MLGSECGFTMVPNKIIYNTKLSCEAKYVFVLIISRKNMNNWRWSKRGILKYVNFGRDKLNRTIDELVSNGLVVKEKGRKQGRFHYISYIPCTENQLMVNQQHINNNINNKDIINNKRKSDKIINDVAKNFSF